MTTESQRETIKFKRAPTRRKLTKRIVEALAAPAAVDGKAVQDWTYDSQTPRLALCTWSSGTKVWYWIGRFGRSMVRLKLGGFPELPPERARKMAARVSADVAAGHDPRQERRQGREELTFSALFAKYLEEHAKQHKRSWAEDKAMFDRYCSRLKNRGLSTITKGDIRTLHAKVGERGRYAANRLLSLLSKVFSFAIATDAGFAGANPCKGVQKFKEQQRDRFLQGEELARFFGALDQESPDMRDYFLLCLWTGGRRGNVQAMKWDQLHLDRAEWRIPVTKAGEPQVVHLAAEAVAILRRRQEASTSEYVFPSRRGSKYPHITYQYAAWHRLCKRAALEDIRPHDLRRSLGSWQAASGASLLVIGKSLGHRNQNTTAIYARLDLEPVRKSVDRAVAAMRDAAGGAEKGVWNGQS